MIESGLISSAGCSKLKQTDVLRTEGSEIILFHVQKPNNQTTLQSHINISATVTVEHDWAVLDWAADKLRLHTLLSWDAQKAWLDSDCWNVTEETPANLEEDGCVSMCLCKAFQQRKWFGAVLLTRPISLIKLQYILKSN